MKYRCEYSACEYVLLINRIIMIADYALPRHE